jgi:general L-amino acid transport system substrate-binding protein
VLASETAVQNVADYFAGRGLDVSIVSLQSSDALRSAYEGDSCAAMASDKSNLVGQRTLLTDPSAHELLDDELSREPLGPVVRQTDGNWFDIVSWVVQCTLNAEYLGVNQRNVDQQLASEEAPVQRLLGVTGQPGEGLGLQDDFCYQVVAQVGNYADIYTRHFGPDTPLQLPRGRNALFSNGGLHYPLPFQ